MFRKLTAFCILSSVWALPFVSTAQVDETGISPEAALAALQAAAIDQEADFAKALADAETAHVAEPSILESRLLHSLGASGGLQVAMNLIPELDKHWEAIETGPGKFFETQNGLLGMIENLKALRANAQGDDAGFELHAKEAFWQSPELTQMFGLGRIIEEMRQAKIVAATMSSISLPLDLQIASIDGSTTSLNQLLAENQAVLLDFWASWCGPCIRLMPALKHKSEVLSPQGIFVAGMNTDSSDALAKAKKTFADKEMNMPWLIEPADSPFSGMLMIDSIPRMILIGQGGAVLFNGHPMDDGLGVALAKLGATL